MRYLRRFNESLSQEEYFEELVRKFKSAEGSFSSLDELIQYGC